MYIIEANPRASRTVPFVAKAIGHPLAAYASLLMSGKTLADIKFTEVGAVRCSAGWAGRGRGGVGGGGVLRRRLVGGGCSSGALPAFPGGRQASSSKLRPCLLTALLLLPPHCCRRRPS